MADVILAEARTRALIREVDEPGSPLEFTPYTDTGRGRQRRKHGSSRSRDDDT